MHMASSVHRSAVATMPSRNRIDRIASSLWTGVSSADTAAGAADIVAAPILDGVRVIVSAPCL